MKQVKIFGLVMAVVLIGSVAYYFTNPPKQQSVTNDSTSVSCDSVCVDTAVVSCDSVMVDTTK
jgi:hypothetical protein